MPRNPQQVRAEQRKASLLDAAAVILERDGYPALNTNSMAKEAGAAVGTVYDYFPNKGAVLIALLARYQQRLRVQIMTALSSTDLSTELLVEKAVRAFALFYQNETGYAELWLANQMVPELREAGAAWGTDFGSLISGLVQARSGIEQKQAERIAATLVHSVSAVISLALTKPEAERKTYIEEAVVLAKAYLGSSSSKI